MPIVFPFKFCHFLGINFLFSCQLCPFFGIKFSFHANYILSKLALFWDPFLFHANYVPFQIVNFFWDQIFFSCKFVIPFKIVKNCWDIAIFFRSISFSCHNYVPFQIVKIFGTLIFSCQLCTRQNCQFLEIKTIFKSIVFPSKL